MRTRNIDKEQLVKKKAIGILVKQGLHGFSMNKLARACDISVATLYIYYKDKDDLIMQIVAEELDSMTEHLLKDFDSSLPFAEGLRIQWKNRSAYMTARPTEMLLFEQLRSSSYQDRIFASSNARFKEAMGQFLHNAVTRGEIDPMPVEVFWSVAYGPLYTLLRFSQEGRSVGGHPFTISSAITWQTFEMVLKALKK